ncbi:meiotic recombination protein SPO11 [Schistosoma japonicum]|nr:meiotic recombination protein SPO11 [Schistosoma japonicum]
MSVLSMIEETVFKVIDFLISGDLDKANESYFMELLLKKPVEFTRLMVILKAAHEAIREDKFITKRAIYYSSPVLFKKQSTIDPLLSKICKQFNLPRCAIRINPTMQDRHGCPIKIPNLQLCGLLPSELSSLPIKEEEILNLTKNDKSLLISIQKRGYIHEEFNLLKQVNINRVLSCYGNR